MNDYFDDIYRREFQPISVKNAFSQINLYSGFEGMRDFDLAANLAMVKAGETIHRLKQKATAERTITDLDENLSIATFASGRVMVDKGDARRQGGDFPFYLATGPGRRAKGFKINPRANLENIYDQSRWIDKDRQVIDTALNAGANVVCLGEFDFPPEDFDSTQGRYSASRDAKSQTSNMDQATAESVRTSGVCLCW